MHPDLTDINKKNKNFTEDKYGILETLSMLQDFPKGLRPKPAQPKAKDRSVQARLGAMERVSF